MTEDERDKHIDLLEQEAADLQRRVGAAGLLVIAIFDDGKRFNLFGVGASPIPETELYATLLEDRLSLLQ